jgi:hypothetical protein
MAGERITLSPLAGRGKGEGRSKGPSSRSMAQRIPPIRNCFQRYGAAPRISNAPLTNEDVYRNRDGVLATILAKLAGLPSS